MITNTHSVGVVRDAVIAWRVKHAPPDEEGYSWSLPVVAETADDDLNDMNGFHVKPEHVFHALDTAQGGPVRGRQRGRRHGNDLQRIQGWHRDLVPPARRQIRRLHRGRSGAVQLRTQQQLRIAGVPVGREISDHTVRDEDIGSIIVVVATDAPLDPHSVEARGPPGVAGSGTGMEALRPTAPEIFSSHSQRPTPASRGRKVYTS